MHSLHFSPNKPLATALAEAALKGFTVHHTADDLGPSFVATRAECTRQFANIDQLRTWIAGQSACQEVVHAE